MELRDVERFLVLAEELHFRRAADRLFVTTGRVSQTVRTLEAEIGAPLFARNSRRVRLTPLGERFRVEAERGFTQLRCALREAQAEARGVVGELRVGHFRAIGAAFVARLAAAFEAQHPAHRLLTIPISRQAAFRALRTEQVDVLLLWCPGLDSVRGEGRRAGPVLASDPRAVLVSAGHPLAARTRISIEEVADHELLSLAIDGPRAFVEGWAPRYTPSGKPIRRAEKEMATVLGREPYYLEDTLTVVARSRLAHLTISSVLDYHPYPGLVLVPVNDLPPMLMTLVWRADRETAAISAFTTVAKHIAHTHWRTDRQDAAR
ncbi:LysR family transcriptional regulator [Pseudonocardia acaciae]|uniref:LysR family transcriptional regulator n=1 Tax=Pseudonocardia acaciae TaxID=551276 RepID=UPI000491B582|nr:LysR family transcriptional regulator [Pseudonocardia acaciae]